MEQNRGGHFRLGSSTRFEKSGLNIIYLVLDCRSIRESES